jgi:hypothetical protein
MRGILFERTLKANAERAEKYVSARCGDDPSLRNLLHAEYTQDEAHRLARTLRESGDIEGARRATRLFRKATAICRTLLKKWQPAQIGRPN